MGSAWGKAWGSSWGNSWGQVTLVIKTGGGGYAFRKAEYREDNNYEQLLREDEELIAVIVTCLKTGIIK